MQRVRVATYNIHKCKGLDQRVRPERVLAVLRELDADVIALQEVVSVEDGIRRELDQARYFADELGFSYFVGENRRLQGGAYGNVLLTRIPVRSSRNYDITWRGREPRGCLRTDLDFGAGLLHLFNVHLGTALIERRHQGRLLIGEEILKSSELSGPRILLGDFNEWTRGLATKLLESELESIDVRLHLGRARTYPWAFPVMHLDHIYFDPALIPESLTLHRSRTALVASDHLPLVATFTLPQ